MMPMMPGILRNCLQVKQTERDSLQKLERCIDQEGNFADAVAQVRALMFIERFSRDLDSRLDAIESERFSGSA